MFEATIPFAEGPALVALFGTRDQHLRRIQQALSVQISHRKGEIRIAGSQAAVVEASILLDQLQKLSTAQGGSLSAEDVDHALGPRGSQPDIPEHVPADLAFAGKKVRARTPGQARYMTAIREHDLVFAIGPAGTGKTYLAVAMAVEAFKHKLFKKIVLCRPAVEAGENLGFLPGDLAAKINPYLRPLLDALREMMDFEQIKRFMEQDLIEVLPLAYMRGRTLNDCFIILDEAQNTTIPQMKMFLTRMGERSKIVVSGDPTQTDLPKQTRSGLSDALARLKGIAGIATTQLGKGDIVRHRLVQEIVEAYEESESKRRRTEPPSTNVPR
jgi:phosphate starvation-inducible PhoH-like protein